MTVHRLGSASRSPLIEVSPTSRTPLSSSQKKRLAYNEDFSHYLMAMVLHGRKSQLGPAGMHDDEWLMPLF